MLFICFIFLFTASVFLNLRDRGVSLPMQEPRHVDEREALATSAFPSFSVGSPSLLLSYLLRVLRSPKLCLPGTGKLPLLSRGEFRKRLGFFVKGLFLGNSRQNKR